MSRPLGAPTSFIKFLARYGRSYHYMSKPNFPEGGFKHTMLDPRVDFEILTDIKVPENDQYNFFSCSC